MDIQGYIPQKHYNNIIRNKLKGLIISVITKYLIRIYLYITLSIVGGKVIKVVCILTLI